MGGDENAVLLVDARRHRALAERAAKTEVAAPAGAERIAEDAEVTVPTVADHAACPTPRACRCRPMRPPAPPAWTCAPPCRRTSR